MEISEEQLKRFIELYRRELKINLTPVEAQHRALSLLRYMAFSVSPIANPAQSDTMEMLDLRE